MRAHGRSISIAMPPSTSTCSPADPHSTTRRATSWCPASSSSIAASCCAGTRRDTTRGTTCTGSFCRRSRRSSRSVDVRPAIVAVLLLAGSARAMSVDEAYASIPHRRTVFDRRTATMPADEADVLQRLFALVDRAIVARVTRSGYEPLLAELRALDPPARLRHVHALVIEAVVAEHAYLTTNQQGAVQTASARLHEAYAELLRLFPDESPHNRDAFFDYLCALDFL